MGSYRCTRNGLRVLWRRDSPAHFSPLPKGRNTAKAARTADDGVRGGSRATEHEDSLKTSHTIMKALLATALLSLALAAHAAAASQWPGEPKEYRGLPFGTSEKEVASKLDLDAAVACLAIEGQRSCIHHTTIGEAKVVEVYQFEGDGLVQVHISFKSAAYEQVRDLFVERYGKPGETSHEPFETVGGRSAMNEFLEWRGGKLILQMEKFGPSLHESLAVIATRDWYDKTPEE